MSDCFGPSNSRRSWQMAFLAMLPSIRKSIAISLRHLRGDARAEAIQEATANACVAFARLFHQGRQERAFPTTLARFAVAQVQQGRTVGSSLNVYEVLSRYAQQRKRFAVSRLDRFDNKEQDWREVVVEDRRTPVVDQVWFRIDFPEWLAQLPSRNRRVAKFLAIGNSTAETARQFKVSPSRISQLRRELHQSWLEFHGECPTQPDGDPAGHPVAES